MATLFERTRKIVADQLGVEEAEVKPTSHFAEDLGADSLDLVELIMAFEDKFKLEISDGDAENIIIVQDLIDYLAGRGIKDEE